MGQLEKNFLGGGSATRKNFSSRADPCAGSINKKENNTFYPCDCRKYMDFQHTGGKVSATTRSAQGSELHQEDSDHSGNC